MSGLSSLDGRMGTLPMHSGFILKDYSEKVKRPAGSCQAAGRAAKRKSHRIRSAANSLSKNLVEFRRRSGERKSNHFLRRHARRRKYFSACKRARRPPWADGACAAVRPQTPLSKKRRFFDSLTPWVCAYCTGSWGFSLFRALAAQEKDQQRQQRTGEIARRVEPDVRDLSAAAGDKELDRLVAQRCERAGQQRSRP